MGRIHRQRRKVSKLPSFPARTRIAFGYDDGCALTVAMEAEASDLQPGANRADHCVFLRGRALDRVCGAALALCGYSISPSLRTLGLRKYQNGLATTIHFHNEEDPDFTNVSLSVYKGHSGMRVWVQTRGTFHNFHFGQKAMDEFLRRLTESAGWDADGIAAPEPEELGPMGQKVLEHVISTFPPDRFPRVADVAGGDGHLAVGLREAGYKATVIDPAAHCVPKGVVVLRRKFLVQDAERFDLLVGLGPCDVSQKLVRAAKRTPVVFVPCRCRRVWPGSRAAVLEASAFLTKQKIPFQKDGVMFWTGAPN